MKSILAICFLFILVNGCKKSDTPPAPPDRLLSPAIKSLSPDSGAYNSIITINGSGFDSVVANNHVTINGVAATVQSATSTSLHVVIPERAGSGSIVVTNGNGSSNAGAFTYLPTIFVGGGEDIGNGFTEAKYWRNGVAIKLSDSGFVNSMTVSGNDVYLAGNWYNPVVKGIVAIYWKNGEKNILSTNNVPEGSILSIFLSGNDIYAAGTALDTINGRNIGFTWKNGVPTMLDAGTDNQVCNKICVSGADTYVASFLWDLQSGSSLARLLKNNVEILLSHSSIAPPSTITSIVASGNDIYAAGDETFNGHSVATYWKNGKEILLTDTTMNSGATAIAVSGNDVYVSGFMMSGSEVVGVYWKNGIPTILAGNRPAPEAIQVFDNNVYVAGNETMGTVDVGAYWKNGLITRLTDGSRRANVTSIFIQ